MPIDLGLSRVVSLLTKLGSPHLKQNYVHIAGTNGKGSVCAYISSILLSTSQNFKVGKFTSPHLIYRHDCITLNNKPIHWELFRKVEENVIQLNKYHDIGCTEFEILTIVALKIFELEKVDLAVLEVGLGGRLDATNVVSGAKIAEEGIIEKKGVLGTAITKIGKDHENFLGDTLSKIGFEKAGIIKPGIVHVVDGSNDQEVLDVVKKQAIKEGSQNHVVLTDSNKIQTRWGIINREESPLKGQYQLQNLSVSLKLIDLISPFLEKSYPGIFKFTASSIIKGIQATSWPGRLQSLNLNYDTDSISLPVLLDGAHNAQSAKELRKYLTSTYGNKSLTFVLAFTKGKDINEVLKELDIKGTDKVVITQFGGVDGMPWIKANDPQDIEPIVERYTENITIEKTLPSLFKSIQNDGNVIVCGSLYLVGEVLKLHEQVDRT